MTMCAYGNCLREHKAGVYAVVVTVTHNASDERQRVHFCCQDHASKWLAKQAEAKAFAQLPEGGA